MINHPFLAIHPESSRPNPSLRDRRLGTVREILSRIRHGEVLSLNNGTGIPGSLTTGFRSLSF